MAACCGNAWWLPVLGVLPDYGDTGGDLAILRWGQTAAITRLGRNGSLVSTKALSFLPVGQSPKRTADGSFVTLALLDVPNRIYAPVTIAPDGGAQIHAQLSPVPHSEVSMAALSGADGTTYFATYSRKNPRRNSVVRVNADGAPAWRKTFTDNTPRAFAADAQRVCMSTQHYERLDVVRRVECRRADTGDLQWTALLKPSSATIAQPASIRLLTDGSLVVVYEAEAASGTVVHREIYSSAGTLSHSFSNEGQLGRVVINAAGDTAFTAGKSGVVTLVRVDRNNQRRYAVQLTEPTWLTELAMDDAGGVVMTQLRPGIASDTTVTYRDANGGLRWSVTLPTVSDAAQLHVDRGSVYILALCPPHPIATDNCAEKDSFFRIGLVDGVVRWRVDAARLEHGNSHILGSPDGRRVLLVQSDGATVRMRRHDSATGAPFSETRRACAGYCGILQATISAGGIGRFVRTLWSTSELGRVAIVTEDDVMDEAARIRVDQSGLSGAWWSPYASGEGLVLDWLPDSRTLFMPWFTYSRDGGNDPAQLRWYTLQAGDVAANATQVQLSITASTGGRFDAAEGVSHTRVGTATLRFTGCDRGTLDYVFDAAHNGGAKGSITLSRLTPATTDCILADGTVQPVNTPLPSKGFDARMSGSWFSPETPGQGLQLAVQPDGILFAPWFTYDPADAGNDAGRQHWFALSGSLAGASNGVVTVPIAQSIGGAFDRTPTANIYPVGTATLTMLACDRARMDYRFDSTESTGAFAGKSGSVTLVKAGGCVP
ncbi:hypothetical protein [Tahibacter amnicola]|uniref:Pyrroloquinoline-quinone binding quinoprotein n=1 Tax=Tahibacter amnicola TaxID=2976241 RepID=A0ABY6BHQ7_9GAMM|nr:hypothetical protein [Tahibacter amnicola]UXI69324.1 hypothetical protein N4264_06655 [Tahibacter amnicola]